MALLDVEQLSVEFPQRRGVLQALALLEPLEGRRSHAANI